MGEIADAMLDGTLCEGCGEYIGSDAGYPQYCSPGCAGDRGVEPEESAPKHRVPPYRCDYGCAKGFRTPGALSQHRYDKHGGNKSDRKAMVDSHRDLLDACDVMILAFQSSLGNFAEDQLDSWNQARSAAGHAHKLTDKTPPK